MRHLMAALVLTGLANSAFGQFNPPLSLPPAPQTPQARPTAPQATLPPPSGQPNPAPYPAKMSIIDPKGVEVRSGPTEKYLATSRLKYGDSVTVLRESKDQPGWFAIVPPAGSFSWIDAKNVMQVERNQAVVMVDQAPVLPGSALVNQEPNAEGAKLASGFVVVLLQERPMDTNGRKWWPIQPPGSEARFIPKEAVQPAQTASVRPPNWSQPTAPAGGWTAPGQTAPGQLVGNPGNPGSQQAGTPASFTQPANQWTQHNGLTTQPPQWSQWGKLRRTAFEKDGQMMCVLEDRQGRPLMYVTTVAGTSLRSYLDQTVCLYGTVSYRSDGYQRTYYMTASHVATP
ncbi:MAG: SH3 domain-containing protein [Gemmataceae bacterium]|nr:SH3 domain-containing protein [Gemmataceae bacterium]